MILVEFQTLLPGHTDIMDLVYGGGGWGAKGRFFHIFNRKAAIVCSLKCTDNHSSPFRPVRSLKAV